MRLSTYKFLLLPFLPSFCFSGAARKCSAHRLSRIGDVPDVTHEPNPVGGQSHIGPCWPIFLVAVAWVQASCGDVLVRYPCFWEGSRTSRDPATGGIMPDSCGQRPADTTRPSNLGSVLVWERAQMRIR